MIFFPEHRGKGRIFFAKNSDREPDEPQLVEIIPAMDHIRGSRVKTTYIEIPQVEHTNAIIISRPYWMWGAEMGVNEYGVAIGNEAIFTKRKKGGSNGLIGMDLLRLALERSRDRFQASETIISLVKQYGQEGPCGHRNKKLRYDNAFLITDGEGALILEIYGKEWALKEIHHTASISNVINFTTDYDLASEGLIENAPRKILEDGKLNIYKSYSDWLYTTFAGGKERKKLFRKLTKDKKNFTLTEVFEILRSHRRERFHPARGSNGDICMHTGDPLVRISQTAASLVVEYEDDENFQVYATGTPLACTSFFIPVNFDSREFIPGDKAGYGIYTQGSWWWEHETLNRYLSLRWRFHREFREMRDTLETKYINLYKNSPSRRIREEYIESIRNLRNDFLMKIKNHHSCWRHPLFRLYMTRLNRKNGIPGY